MRKIHVVSGSIKKSHKKTSSVLDRYLNRTSPRSWSGKLCDQALKRLSDDIKAIATRQTYISVFVSNKDKPIFTIGSKQKLSKDGTFPKSIKSINKKIHHIDKNTQQEAILAVVRIASIFHDVGKATHIFQEKLHRFLKNEKENGPDPLRHEYFSAIFFDSLFKNEKTDASFIEKLKNISDLEIENSLNFASEECNRIADNPNAKFKFDFINQDDVKKSIGLLILSHHKLASLGERHLSYDLTPSEYKNEADSKIFDKFDQNGKNFKIKNEHFRDIFIKDQKWKDRLSENAKILNSLHPSEASIDAYARGALIFADRYGSAKKEESSDLNSTLANTTQSGDGSEKSVPADNLHQHTERVYKATRPALSAIFREQENYPGIEEKDIPSQILHPKQDGHYAWQGLAAKKAADLAKTSEGGFFACLMAGTGTGKTRAAPTILTAATLHDKNHNRQKVRFTLGLGLVTLANQSGEEYQNELGFKNRDIKIIVGRPKIDFDDKDENEDFESLNVMPVKEEQNLFYKKTNDHKNIDEEKWLKSLGEKQKQQISQFVKDYAEEEFSEKNAKKVIDFAQTPILCATIDNIIGVAFPNKTSHVIPLVRVATSDLILDEIDQYDNESLHNVARLVYLSGIYGRRVIIMSATITRDIAEFFYKSYAKGWSEFSKIKNRPDHVNYIVTSEFTNALQSSDTCQSFSDAFKKSSEQTSLSIDKRVQKTKITLVENKRSENTDYAHEAHIASEFINKMHAENANSIDKFKISFGFLRYTKVEDTINIAVELSKIEQPGTLRKFVCLHANMMPFVRQWIERELKIALNRKGSNPHKGLKDLCQKEGLFEQARKNTITNIQIVLVASPVVETGNDLDFDYCLIDPNSTRSLVQAAGRVMRHRQCLIEEGSKIGLLQNLLCTPSIDFPVKIVTEVIKSAIQIKTNKKSSQIFNAVEGTPVNPNMVLYAESELCKAEQKLLKDFFISENEADLESWCNNLVLRSTKNVNQMRKFRRQEEEKIEFWLNDIEDQKSWSEKDQLTKTIKRIKTRKKDNDLQNPLFSNVFNRASEKIKKITDRGFIKAVTSISISIKTEYLYSNNLGLF